MAETVNSWKTLKLPPEVFEAYKEIQKELKEKHKKPFSNTDVMKFFIYLAKIALELKDNPKIEGLAEPITYTTLRKLDANCQSVANVFEIPIHYLRVGVLWGLLELAKEEIKKENWRMCKYYLELAHNWFDEYELSYYDIYDNYDNYYGNEISKLIAHIIDEIPRIGQKNPNRQKIHDQLFKELENIVSTFFENPPYKIIKVLILNELRSQNYGRALRLLKMTLVSRGYGDSEELNKLVKKFLKEVGNNLESEEYKKYVEELLRASYSYCEELYVLETASEFIDVKPFYEELISRKYLSPDDRLVIIESMVKASSRGKNSSLIEYAISMAKNEFKKHKDEDYNLYGFGGREYLARILGEYGFSDRIIELKFPDEVPTINYYIRIIYSKLNNDNFEEKWDELKYIIAKYFYCKDYRYYSSKLFIPADTVKEELDMDIPIDLNEVFQKLKVEVAWYGDVWHMDEEVGWELYVYFDGNRYDELNFGGHLIHENVLEQLLKKLLESGVELVEGEYTSCKLLTVKLLNRICCKDLANKLIDNLAKDVIHHVDNPKYFKILYESGIDPLDILKKAINKLFNEECNTEKDVCHILSTYSWHIIHGCVNMLAYMKPYEEVIELIESGNIFKLLYDDFKLFDEAMAEQTRYYAESLQESLHYMLENHKKMLMCSFLDVLMEKECPKITAEFILKHNIATPKLTRLINELIEKGHTDLADRVYSEFGLGWMGYEYLETILILRFESCVDSLKKGNEKEFLENYKAMFSLLRSSRKKLNKENYEMIGGKLTGRLIAWKLIHFEG
jgi:DNA-directed RNA polymerase subunit L